MGPIYKYLGGGVWVGCNFTYVPGCEIKYSTKQLLFGIN
jgi:hypothetical protein